MLSVLLLLCASGVQREVAPPAAPALAVQLEPIRARAELPALAGAVVDARGLRALEVCGLRAAGTSAAVERDDRWHLGSCTKALTATLAARLVEQGLVRWETTLGEVFGPAAPPARRVEGFDEAWADARLEALLQHRGGAPARLPPGLWLALRLRGGTPRAQRRALVEGLLEAAPSSPPGRAFEYSNAGYALAGALLEELADASFEELIERELFVPLGMDEAGFGPPGSVDGLDQPRGHEALESGGWQAVPPLALADNPAAIGPAGGVHASLASWARFVRAHLVEDESYLASASWKRLHEPPEGAEYALGWAVVEPAWTAGPLLGHSGSNTLWYCTVWLAPRDGLGVLVATNGGGERAARACDEAAAALLERVRER